MEETPEGLAAAAATREAARLGKRSESDAAGKATASPAASQKGEEKRAAAATTTTNASTSSAAAAPPAAAAASQPPQPPPPPKPPAVHEVLFPPSYDPKTSRAALLDAGGLHGTLADPWWRGEPAKKFPFELDPFQRTAVGCLERREAVLVAAHTAAGKTAVAEYAVAMALRDRQRVVYTSPLKALSNQKYRELAEEFGDVGLLTGDVCIAPHAPVLVMTTEILRSMLYRGDEGLRETAWVVFDEIHYMQDRERGVVWEEAIIFLPPGATPVFLSATLSNAAEFASWVAKLRNQPCHVVYTDYRPTPLQHYAFPLGGKGLYLLADERGGFRADNFARMRKEAFGLVEEEEKEEEDYGEEGGGKGEEGADGEEEGEIAGRGAKGGRGGGGRGGGGGGGGGGRGGGGRGTSGGAGRGGASAASTAPAHALSAAVSKMVRLVKDKSLDPVIVFSFSRRACEAYATTLSRGDRGGEDGRKKNKNKGENGGKPSNSNPGDRALSFNSEEEALAVDAVFDRAVECIADPGDRDLAAVAAMRPMLRRGVGVHHSGLLPILKELVELLFQEGLVKALFATETFAMGLNMPAKTVVFTELRKWDGQAHRWVTSGEYIQMSGRAGRRGKDDRGVCISVVDDAFDGPAARALLKGGAAPLLSSFRLSYYTLLNLARRAGGGAGRDAEFVVSRSFRQHQHEAAAPLLQRAADEAQRGAEGAAEAAVRAVEAGISASDAPVPSPEKKKRRKQGDGGNDGGGDETSSGATRALVEGLVSLLADAARCRRALVEALLSPASRAADFLRPGRLVRVRDGGDDWGWGIAVAVAKNATATPAERERKGDEEAVAAAAADSAAADADVVVDVLLACEPGSVSVGSGGENNGASPSLPRPASRATRKKKRAEAHVLPVPLGLVEAVSSLRVGVPADLRSREAKAAALATLDALEATYGPGGTKSKESGEGKETPAALALFPSLFLGSYPLLDPVADAGAGNDGAVLSASRRLPELEREVSELLLRLRASSSSDSLSSPQTPRMEALEVAAPQIEAAARARAAALARAEALSAAARSSQVDLYRAEARKRTAVLKILGHLDEDGVLLTLKGRAAAEVDAADELLASELMFNGVFAGLDAPRLAALVSCLVPCEKSQTVVELAASLAGPLAELQATARRIADVQVECGVFARGGGSGFVGGGGGGRGGGSNNAGGGAQQEQAAASSVTTSAEAELYCDSFKPTLMDAVATWASGGTFQQAVDRTEMFEGSLIRAIRRLDEVLGQLGGAAEAVGDAGLAARFAAASAAIRRGIVFAASLYI